jgi:hypothetical protein
MSSRVCLAGCIVLIAIMGSLRPARAVAQPPVADPLADGFRHPPAAALPRTWWHWTNGHVTQYGITKDLEWMHRVGIGGMQLADVAAGGGQTIDQPLAFGSPGWLDAVKHAAAEAQRLGLELTIFSSSGWSLTGGPWVTPEQAMKKLVWSTSHIDGGKPVQLKLPQPPDNNGPFRDIGAGGPRRDPTFYADAAVIAFPTPAAESAGADSPPQVTASGGELTAADAARLTDDSYAADVRVRAARDGAAAGNPVAWLHYEYAEPAIAQAVTIAGPGGIPVGRVLASDDGQLWRTLVTLPGAQLYRQGRVRTFAFPLTRAKFFRIEFTAAPLGPGPTMSQEPPQPAEQYALWEARFHAGARVHRWQEKAAFGHLFEYDSVPTPPVAADAAVPHEGVIDLTDKMAADGTLTWQAPPGQWTVLRMGYSLTGAKNRPATPAGSGYEVDKLSREHATAYYEAYAGMLKSALGDLYGKQGLSHMLLDSWEAGQQNWTDQMLAEFERRRGYDPRPYLPALTGVVIDSADASDRFLWDFRRTLADMFADNHYAAMTELLHRDGLESYSEASGVSLEIPEDTLLNKSKVDVPMGEFWVRDLHPRLMYFQDVRGAASAAHAYGKPFVAAESFTGGGYESPATLKRVADYWLSQGINRLVFHTSAHQPLDTKPGNTMVGTHINRNITWAEDARPLMDYFARVSYLLQQGRFAADVAYLLNEGAPSTMPIWGAGTSPAPPAGYDYDFLNADALLNLASANADGELALPAGMHYRVLVLPESRRMRPELIRKLRELVLGGVTIVGPRPVASPSLMGGPDADREAAQLAADLWGDLDGVSRTIRYVGKGRVVWGRPLAEVLAMLQLPPDFAYSAGLDAELAWQHRELPEADVYFVANCTDQPRRVDARFGADGREAELWRPDTGAIEPASYRIASGRTTVPLELAPRESVFVVFRNAAREPSRTIAPPAMETLATIVGPWNVSFPPKLGAPAEIQLDATGPWTDSDLPGVKYFSGTATYAMNFPAPGAAARAGGRVYLDLGDVRDLATVSLNGQIVGTAWKPPFRVDVTAALQDGVNKLEVAVTNEWTNRILGDARVPADQRVLDRGGPGRGGGPGGGLGFGPREPSVSGLVGPVTLLLEAK